MERYNDCWDEFDELDDDDDGDYFGDIDEEMIDGVGFASPGSALRAETEDNPRNLPCPTCERPNMLTPIDAQRGYQCDICADAAEGHGMSLSEY